MPTLLIRGEPIGEVKGVLFDKDGTLSNSEGHLLKLANLRIEKASRLLFPEGEGLSDVEKLKTLLSKAYGLNKKGLSPNGTIAIASREDNLISTATVFCLLGQTWPKALDLAFKVFQLVDDMEAEEINNAKQRSLLPGARKTLQNLQNADITCALISNDTHQGIENFLFHNNLKCLMKYFWSADNLPPKPNPAAVKEFCKRLNLQPSECALIGDSDSDLKMARQSGILITIGYTGGWSQKPYLNEYQHLIDSWNEIEVRQNIKVSPKSDAS